MNKGKFIGSIMLVVGTTIGAGMLALPTACAAAGFGFSALLMILMWGVAIITGLMLIEVNLAFPQEHCSYNTMTAQTLGLVGKVVTWFSYLFLLYTITTAYIAGASDTFTTTLQALLHGNLPSWSMALSFTLILGGAVFWSTRAVDLLNRGLLSIKTLLLVGVLALILPHVDLQQLFASQDLAHTKYLLATIPTFLTAFSYQFIIPSLRIYIGEKPRELKLIVIIGSTISLLIYLLWLAATLGTIPLTGTSSFANWAQNHGSVGELMRIMTVIINNNWVTSCIYGFTNVAMTTSFLGVTLGLFDFLADGFKRPNTKFGRLQTAILTFLPPLLLALLYPKGFEKAIICAAVFITLLIVFLPTMMLYRLRKMKQLQSPYRVFGGPSLIFIMLGISLLLLILSVMTMFHLLPTL